MNAGELKHTIVFKKNDITVDDVGNEIDGFVDFYTCKAKVNGVGGREYYAASQNNAENDVDFTVRYCKKLAELTPQLYIIVFNDVAYDIKNIDNYMMSNETLKIKATAKAGV